MANLSLIIGILTMIGGCIGLLFAVNINSRRMRFIGRGMLAGTAMGGIYIGLMVGWDFALFAVGAGLVVAVVLLYFFISAGSF